MRCADNGCKLVLLFVDFGQILMALNGLLRSKRLLLLIISEYPWLPGEH